ncbi:endo-1,4-beta-xylanase [Waterburya agarophytonicola K14]|uniref:Beta-xylanase n=1 Tax=Waterburya agarophytonicola KI4 TaxID=2874699 RepID=A0A964BMA1_9CYAN|nr:endo-1,4-beta-xylanase [Waterburya agarophytonicola]MCC0175953.1 endo-1,4-beta-xylanase [Waterburya agarophytonicola KI4]
MTKNKYQKGRRSFLLGLGGFSALSLVHKHLSSTAQAEEVREYINNLTKQNNKARGETLRQLAAAKGIKYGGFTQRSHTDISNDQKFQRIFTREYEVVVGGFFGVTVGPFGNNNYNFSQTDAFLNFANQNQLDFRGHPLIWNEFNSDWLINKFKASETTNSEIDTIFTNHIKTIAQRHAGKVSSWDVVNEAIRVEDGRSDNLKDTTKSGVRGEKYRTWLNFLGPDYIERAFKIAAEADPNAILTYNDNGLTYSNPFGSSYEEQRRAAILRLLERLKAKGTPVHALGIQSHLEGHRNKEFDAQKFRKFLSDVASMGIKIIISELDVRDNKLPKNIAERDRAVAEAYYQYLSVVLDEPAVTTIISWGLSDRHTWISSFAPRQDGAAVRPLLLDQQYEPKSAWKAVARALKEAPSRL